MNKKIMLTAGAVALFVVLLIVAIILGVDWTTTVGICYRDTSDPVDVQLRRSLEKSLMDQGYEVIVSDASGDQAMQNRMIGMLADQRCDVLIVEPVQTTAGEQLQQAVKSTGLPCVLINRPLEMETEYAYVGMDIDQFGILQGQMVNQMLNGGDINGDGTLCYMVIEGTAGQLTTEVRTRSLENALDSSTLQTQLLCMDNGDWTEEGGYDICSRELARFGRDIEVIFCANDAMARGAAQAVKDGGWQTGTHFYLFGIGNEAATLELIHDGSITGSVAWDLQAYTAAVVQAVQSNLTGQKAQGQIVPCTVVTAQNIEAES